MRPDLPISLAHALQEPGRRWALLARAASAYQETEDFSHATPEEVKALADEVGHPLPSTGTRDGRDALRFPGRHYASHAEKQLAIVRPNHAVAVSKDMCPNCESFYQRLAVHRNVVQVVTDPEVTRVFRPDGSIQFVSRTLR